MFELTKSRLGTNNFPIVKTDNMNDLSIADQYSNTHTHIWLVNEKNEILETFNWNWKPPREQFFNVHSFPRCMKNNKKPVSWNSVMLVPTRNRSDVIRQSIISSYYGRLLKYPVYFYNIIDNKTVSYKLNNLKTQYPNCEFLVGNNLNNIIENIECDETHYFLIDINVILENDILSTVFLDDVSKHDCVAFGVSRQSTDTIFYDYSAMLIPRYVKSLEQIQFTTAHETVGKIMDLSTPEKSWIIAYRATYLLQKNIFSENKSSKNKVLTDFLSKQETEKSRLYKFIHDGSVCATMDLETEDISLENVFDVEFMKNKFRENQEKKNVYVLTKSQQKQRDQKIEQIYGKKIKKINIG